MPAGHLVRTDVFAWHRQLRDGRPWMGKDDKGLAASTAREHVVRLSVVMNGAVEDGIILRNVVKLPKQDSTAQVLRSDIPPMESVHKIVEQLNAGGARFHTNLRVKGSRTKWEPGVSAQLPQPVIAAMVGVALGSGMRLSELCALRREDIDFLRREIRVDAQLSPDGKSRVPTKTKSSIRVIPIADDLLELLDYQVSQSVNGWIFETNRGTPYRAASAGAELRKTVRHLTFEVTFHTFRHMFATTLISSGVSVKQVQTLMGHASAATTLDVYSHFFPGDDDVSRNAIFGVVESLKILRRFSDNSGDTDGDDLQKQA
ncbi:tyrosine-type recombinase/integrase [Corynebacterium callunae]|nr:site-specific integrase [Corynebacterium callunae]